MNNLAQDKEQFNFYYSPFEFTDYSDLFLNLSKDYYKTNLEHLDRLNQKVDLICDISTREGLSVAEIKERISDKFLSRYLDSVFEEALGAGIQSIAHFRIWIQSNHKDLNCPSLQLDPHTHTDDGREDLFKNDAILTHTVITPIQITNEITETFWAKWVDDIAKTVPSKLKILKSIDASRVPKDIHESAFSDWWNDLYNNVKADTLDIKLPNIGEKLTIDFNSRSYVHGINNLSDNLYLIILFDRIKK